MVTETYHQVNLSLWVLKAYGIEEKIQLISLGLSWICQYKAIIDRIAFTRYQNPTTCQILGTWIEWLVLILLQAGLTMDIAADESKPPWFPLVAVIVLQVSIALTYLFRFLLPKKTFKSITNIIAQIPFCYTYIFLGLFFYPMFYWDLMVILISTVPFFINFYLLYTFFCSWIKQTSCLKPHMREKEILMFVHKPIQQVI